MPSRVDQGSGYRYYDTAQLDQARLVVMLRQSQLPLAAIKELLTCDPADAAKRSPSTGATPKRPRRAARAADDLVNRLSGKRSAMYEVATREMPERSLLCLKRNVEEQEMWAFGKEFIAILRERPLPKIEGREGAAFCIWWGLVNADGDGPIEWCAPVPAAQAESLRRDYPELSLRTEPAHLEAFVALPDPDAGDEAATGSSPPGHWRLGRRSRSRSTRAIVLPSRPQTSACASPTLPARWAPGSRSATWPFCSRSSDDRSERPGQALRNSVTGYWPSQAGARSPASTSRPSTLQPWPGFGVTRLFAAIVYAIAWTLLERRDA